MSTDAVEPTPLVKSISRWLSACDTQHACVVSPKSPRATDQNPTWLIDTHQECILTGATAGRYLALSYVWAENMEYAQNTGAQPVRLDRARLLHFQTPGSLKDPSNPLPMVIRDAISLTKMIGERYLWVDRFCIVQDAHDTTSEVMKMDQIYSNAYLTIISAGNYGLLRPSTLIRLDSRGVTGLSTSRTSSSSNEGHDYCPSAEYVNNQIKAHYRNLAASKWATRGWTYQEQILSKRSIVFLDHEVFWECDQSVWDGHKLSPGNDGPSTSEASEMGRRLSALRWSDFSLYIDLVCLYNHRDFSYPQDALPAISGIFNILEPVYQGGFIGGLPSSFLDCSLLWQPLRKATRRVHLQNDLGISGSGPSLPSWSWCGWQCLVDPWSLRSGISYIHTEKHQGLAGTWRTYNLVIWSITTPSGDQRTKIGHSRMDKEVEKIPSGRNCDIDVVRSNRDVANIGSTDGPVVMSSYNRDASTSFKPPIRIGEASSSYNINNTPLWLHCATTRVFFRPAAVLQAMSLGIVLGAPKISAFEHPLFTSCPKKDQVTPVMVLQDMSGRRSGLLRLMHDEEDYDHLGEIELIAISAGSCSVRDMAGCFEQQALNGKVEWPGSTMILSFGPTWLHKTLRSEGGLESDSRRLTLPSSLRQGSVTYGIDDICHFYNVLWIERKDGIAYRRACGRILKPIWERNGYEKTEVILG